jgi:CubicO group peptidase (beta-lactamase class C family)
MRNLAVSLILLSSIAVAQTTVVPEKQWGETVTGLMRKGDIPGLSIAVIRDGKIDWEGEFGQKNAVNDGVTDGPVLRDTLFSAASMGKPVFAYIVLRLVDRGVIDLDKPLYTYGFAYDRIDKDPRSKLITARMVLDHTTGLPNWGGTPLEFLFTPGEKFSYSGEGYVYLQKVVEHLTGKSLEELAQQEVFVPLKMEHSTFRWRPILANQVAIGKLETDQPITWDSPSENSASSLLTTANDYAKFLIALMDGVGLKQATFQQMWSAQVAVPQKGPGISFGLGWGIEQTGASKYIYHGGNNVAFKGAAFACPEKREGLVYLTNSEGGMTIESALVKAIEGGDHPGLFSETEPYTSQRWAARAELIRLFTKDNLDEALRRYRELKAEQPKTIDEDLTRILGRYLGNNGRLEAAIAVSKENVHNYPKSARAVDSLIWAYVLAGNVPLAIQTDKLAREVDPPHKDRWDSIESWLTEYQAHLEKPFDLPETTLKNYAGVYDAGQVSVKDGYLTFTPSFNKVDRRLIAASADTFYVAGDPSTKLQFSRNPDGDPVDVVISRILGV